MIKKKKEHIRIFSTVEALIGSAAQLIVDLAKKSVEEKGRFILCLSGGETPKGLYSLLSMKPYCDLVPWKNTFVFWSDERFVPAEDDRNNANMATSALLSKIDIPSTHIFPIPVNLLPEEAAKKYEETLQAFFGNETPHFDLVLLGIGEDGHTASLFPGTAVLNEKLHWVKEVYVDDLKMVRITMTALLINKARHILFLVKGKEKSAILKTILMTQLQPEKYPVQMIRPEQGEVSLYIDDKAASRLPESLKKL